MKHKQINKTNGLTTKCAAFRQNTLQIHTAQATI